MSWDHRPDDGGSKNIWNVGKLLPDYTALQPRRQPSSYSPPWESQIPLLHLCHLICELPTEAKWLFGCTLSVPVLHSHIYFLSVLDFILFSQLPRYRSPLPKPPSTTSQVFIIVDPLSIDYGLCSNLDKPKKKVNVQSAKAKWTKSFLAVTFASYIYTIILC
jgi:hypothetical protein